MAKSKPAESPKEEVRPEKTLEATKKEKGFLVTPDVYQQVNQLLTNSIPKVHSVGEALVIIELFRNSRQVEFTFNQ